MSRDGEPDARAGDDAFDLEAFLERNPRSFMLKTIPFELTPSNFGDVIEEHFVFVGIAENLQATVDGLAVRLGFPTLHVGRENASERTQGCPSSAKDRFRENNQLEYAIYEYARSRFDSG